MLLLGTYVHLLKLMNIRGYMSGHSAREYKAGKRILCGVEMPDGLNENDAFKSQL